MRRELSAGPVPRVAGFRSGHLGLNVSGGYSRSCRKDRYRNELRAVFSNIGPEGAIAITGTARSISASVMPEHDGF